MCQMDAHMEPLPQQVPFNAEKRCSEGFASSKAEKFPSAIDSGKKKRVQRAAKLKQCKMDARREQWLAQVSSKINKSDSCASSHTSSQEDRDDKDLLLQSSPGDLDFGKVDGKDVSKQLEVKGSVRGGLGDGVGESGKRLCESIGLGHRQEVHMDGTKQNPLCQVYSEANLGVGFIKAGVYKESERETAEGRRLDIQGFRSVWSCSDSGTSHSNSSLVSSSSDDENEVEDWEAVADALRVQASVQDVKPKSEDQKGSLDPINVALTSASFDNLVSKPESKYRPGNYASRMRGADAGRAWRPDDVSRPQTLPCLSKQHSFPLQSGSALWAASHGNVWGLPPPPSHCPICTEELDTTDSSFVPCSCGFRLCLFCHHRILIGDGRCPGCRKSYNSEVALKLSRTSSVRYKV